MKRHKVDKINNNSEEISEEVFESIHKLMHLIRSEQYRVLRDSPYKLTHMEGKMLGYFYHHAGASLRDLVAHTGRDKGQLARTIKTLKEQGLLQAEADPDDRRSQLLSLTDEGRRIHESLIGRLQRLTKIAVHDMSQADCEHLLALLGKVRDNLENGEA
ncbi:MarR family winged helix-turn-helix transcriptional regulator [Cerasicoccus fimbriatus]|uniref:MarR family winged helix-turn-helix transcriptional regulator n=1 Tax=Cerasicoccus fimbriatus TaxID=3014554 RepID=UPI0022B4F2C7|nr:MarR family transcriptional regulator [Cerasicoccus sp. TK19100]